MTEPFDPVKGHDYVGRMRTVSGREVNLPVPEPEQVDLGDIVHALSMIGRYNGHTPFPQYTVAEHCVRVALWLLEREHPPAVALNGLLHDAHEAYVQDMLRPLKLTPDLGAAYLRYEEQCEAFLVPFLGGTWPHPEPVHEADKALYVWEEENIRTGNLLAWDFYTARHRWLALYAVLHVAAHGAPPRLEVPWQA